MRKYIKTTTETNSFSHKIDHILLGYTCVKII